MTKSAKFAVATTLLAGVFFALAVALLREPKSLPDFDECETTAGKPYSRAHAEPVEEVMNELLSSLPPLADWLEPDAPLIVPGAILYFFKNEDDGTRKKVMDVYVHPEWVYFFPETGGVHVRYHKDAFSLVSAAVKTMEAAINQK